MSLVPKSKIDKVQFFENHLDPWGTNSTDIGLSATDVTTLTTKTSAARAAYNDQRAALDAAKAATMSFNTAVSDMASFGSTLIAQIKAKAAGSAAPDTVYALAQIPAPATPSPKPAPGTPTDFKVTLLQDGSIQLDWKCLNPEGTTGTIYEVRRRTNTAGTLAYIGASGTREFVDDTLPFGSTAVTYQVTAVRSTKRGNPAQFNVNFGVGAGGQAFAAVVANPRLAA